MSLIESNQVSPTQVTNKINCVENNVGDKDFVIKTDYPKFRDGEEANPTPWHTFLASYAACQLMELTDYCIEYNLNYKEALVEIDASSTEDYYTEIEGVKRFISGKHLKEIKVIVNFPTGFTDTMKQKVMKDMKECKISELIFNKNENLKLNIIEKKGE